MPEGHVIHRLAREWGELIGEPLTLSSPQGRFDPTPLSGRALTATDAHGKHLLLEFDRELWLRVHLGLYGRFEWHDGEGEALPSVGAVRLRGVYPQGWVDLRGPTACELLTPSAVQDLHQRLGVDPLRAEHDIDEVIEWILTTPTPIGSVLLNQSVIAGVGNVYRAELLFRAGLHPWIPARELDEPTIRGVWRDAQQLLGAGLRWGRIITTRTPPMVSALPPAPQSAATYVYGRGDSPCWACATPIQVQELAGRRVYWCPLCQRSQIP